MLRKYILTGLLLQLYSIAKAQPADSVKLTEVTVQSYLNSRPLLRLPSSVSVVNETEIKKQSGQSLVPVMNTVPGVRMEERSPGSYRLSIRGSLLRSPFGIRNVKIYLEDFPLTDASGNTYLNLLDLHTIHSIEVLKGPDGSLFGANSGGVVRINTFPADTINSVNIGIGGGSYGLFHEYATIKQHLGKNVLQVAEGWQRSDGYRENSRFDRKYVQLADRFQYLPKGKLTVLMFCSDVNYRTPGGLTREQWDRDPRAARPASNFTSGATSQRAGVDNFTLYTGIANQIAINKTWSHTIAVFGSYTDFKNPFITNYEKRLENTLGTRTWFQASNNAEGNVLVKFHAGVEMAQTNANIENYGNMGGFPVGLFQKSKITNNQLFTFSHLMVDFYNKWLLESGLSLNFNSYSFSTYGGYPVIRTAGYQAFAPQLMPKIGLSYQVASILALRGSWSRGYSTPTLAEVLPSSSEINTSLQPEHSWNYEVGFRLRTPNNVAWWDVSAFYYILGKAIVRRLNEAAQEYFVNAGGTRQTGLESQLHLQVLPERKAGFFRNIHFNNSLTFSDFFFNEYTLNSDNYSGNRLTGVPVFVVVSGVQIKFPAQFSLFMQHNYTSSIFLNDANSISADAYHLVFLKAGCTIINHTNFRLGLSAGADNLLNEKYSLGNDLNAAGGRYFNAAMPRNYFGKLELWF